ncbi:PadR family transcriptional regulator [Hellea sp.]|nr:PadR family transcriptional regulator [Hellea sp.]
MTRNRAPSQSTCLVLSELCQQPQYGYALMKKTGLKSGTLYPILMRLKDRGFLTSNWEEPQILGRPPRQSYELTPNGRAYANEVLAPDTQPAILRGIKT